MKRTVLFLIVCSMLFSLCSCSALYGTGDPNNKKEPKTILIIYPNSQETLDVENYRSANFTPKYIENKVLIGFYGQQSKTGHEYFNYKGEMNGTWQPEYPNTVYAIYENINYSTTYKSAIACDENPKNYYYAGYTLKLGTVPSNSEIYQIFYSNPNIDIKIEIHADIKQHGKDAIKSKISFGIGSETFKTESFSSNPDSYTHITLSHTIKAKQLFSASSGVYTKFYWLGSGVDSRGLFKNVYFTVSLVDNTTK